MIDDDSGMRAALRLADDALLVGELPIGAVVVHDGEVVGAAHPREQAERRLLVHAELLALDAADRALAGRDRQGTTLFTTLEPCLLCLAAAATVGVERIVFGLWSPTDGASVAARAWDDTRVPGLDRVRIPALVGGVLAADVEARFRAYVRVRPNGDPFAAWAATVVAPVGSDAAADGGAAGYREPTGRPHADRTGPASV